MLFKLNYIGINMINYIAKMASKIMFKDIFIKKSAIVIVILIYFFNFKLLKVLNYGTIYL